MNEMWSEMSDFQREEYKDYFLSYHNGVAKTGVTGRRGGGAGGGAHKPHQVLPAEIMSGFDRAVMTKVPDDKYLLLPSWGSQLRLRMLSMLPERVSQKLVARRYRKSLPKVSQ